MSTELKLEQVWKREGFADLKTRFAWREKSMNYSLLSTKYSALSTLVRHD